MGEESSPQEDSHEEKPDKPSGKKPRKKKKKAEEGEMSAEEFEDAFNSLNAGDAATEALGKKVLSALRYSGTDQMCWRTTLPARIV